VEETGIPGKITDTCDFFVDKYKIPLENASK
jgi:hypothetical protein